MTGAVHPVPSRSTRPSRSFRPSGVGPGRGLRSQATAGVGGRRRSADLDGESLRDSINPRAGHASEGEDAGPGKGSSHWSLTLAGLTPAVTAGVVIALTAPPLAAQRCAAK